PDDRTFNEELAEQEREHTAPGASSIHYQGYHQYGPNGESVYSFNGAPLVEEPEVVVGDDDEDLRRRLRALRQQAEGEGESQEESQEQSQEETQEEAVETAAEAQ